MERKIGEIFEYNGEWYQCLERDGCLECAFIDIDCDEIQSIGQCIANGREDGKSVTFKKLEKIGEPYEKRISGRVFQKYKVYSSVILPKEPYIYYNSIDSAIEIELKQNMEESVEEKLFCDKVAKANAEYMKAKLNSSLKLFDLKAAKAGKSVYTRDGRKVRILCFDANGSRPIVALVTECDDKEEIPYKYHCDGSYNCQSIPSDNDLMMLPEKKEGWVNIYKSEDANFPAILGCAYVYNTKEEAINNADPDTTIATVKISWEE